MTSINDDPHTSFEHATHETSAGGSGCGRATTALAAGIAAALAAGTGCVPTDDATASAPQAITTAVSPPTVILPGLPLPATSYRVLTYNVQLRPALSCATSECDNEIYNMPNETRASLIADKVLADGQDVVMFNEPFHEGARDVLVERLQGQYPTVVEKLKDGPSLHEDAGLMLFSKFPAVAVPTPAGGECFEPGLGATCLVAFHRYVHSVFPDSLVQNGIGFVRLQNPATGRPLNVFFTHLQANETGVPFAETSAARAAQIGEAKLFINQWAPPASDHDTIVAGDLNVHGAPDGEDDNPDFAEYRDLIVGNGGFGGLGLVDTHRLAASPADTMFSFDGDLDSAQRSASRSRLDYVLFRPATSGIVPCMQQTSLRRGYHVETAPGDDYVGTDLSDHFGLDVTVGRTGPNCSPRTALEVAAGDAQLSRSFGGDGDAVQWFHAATPGTYSFSLGGLTNPIVDNTVDIQVFRDSDLSEPLAADLGSTHLVTQHGVVAPNRVVFALDAPFFVRVRAHDPAFAGGYTLIWHRHQGTSFDDAIALDPATRIGQQQFLDHGGDGPQAVFYSFVQHDLDSGARQALRFATEGHPLAQLRIQVFDGGRHLISGLSTGYAAGQQTLTVNPVTSPIAGARQRLFFTVDRVGCTGVCASAYQVTWTTNLRRLDLSEFQIETDADGATDDDDEVVMRVRVDGGAEQAIGLGQVHKGSVKRLPAGLREIGFASQVLIRFTETDGLLAGADDVSETRTVAAGALPAGLGDRDDLPTLDLPVHRGGLGGAVVGLYHVRLRGGTRIHD